MLLDIAVGFCRWEFPFCEVCSVSVWGCMLMWFNTAEDRGVEHWGVGHLVTGKTLLAKAIAGESGVPF